MDRQFVKKLERIYKGVSNHWRIKILYLISENPEISLENIVKKMRANYSTISEHVKRLFSAGLISKKYKGRIVAHLITPYGKKVLKTFMEFK